MSPAGDFVCLDAALKNGADAVYFGIKGSNMRAGARNFDISELPAAVQKCREYGAKAYLTLNNIYFDSDFPSLDTNIKAAKDAGIDAVIAWDFAAIERALFYGGYRFERAFPRENKPPYPKAFEVRADAVRICDACLRG